VEKELGTTCTRRRVAPVPEASVSRCAGEYPPPSLLVFFVFLF